MNIREHCLLTVSLGLGRQICLTRFFRVGLACSMFVFGTCAFGPIRSLTYKEPTIRTSAAGVTLRVQGAVPLQGPFVVGQKKDLWGLPRGLVHLEQDPREALMENLRLELRDAQISIQDSGPELHIILRQMYVEPSVGVYTTDYLAVTDADVVIAFPGGETLRRRFVGIGLIGASSVLMYSDRLYAEALQTSIRDFAKKAIPEIIRICERRLPDGETP